MWHRPRLAGNLAEDDPSLRSWDKTSRGPWQRGQRLREKRERSVHGCFDKLLCVFSVWVSGSAGETMCCWYLGSPPALRLCRECRASPANVPSKAVKTNAARLVGQAHQLLSANCPGCPCFSALFHSFIQLCTYQLTPGWLWSSSSFSCVMLYSAGSLCFGPELNTDFRFLSPNTTYNLLFLKK